MRSEMRRNGTALAAALALALTSPSILAQAQAGPPSKAAKSYAPPRTPWGDPDLQGNYTNLYEAGTPLERPEQFAGRKLADVKGEELAAVKRAMPLLMTTTEPIMQYECHEGNYGLRNILSAARAQERP